MSVRPEEALDGCRTSSGNKESSECQRIVTNFGDFGEGTLAAFV